MRNVLTHVTEQLVVLSWTKMDVRIITQMKRQVQGVHLVRGREVLVLRLRIMGVPAVNTMYVLVNHLHLKDVKME